MSGLVFWGTAIDLKLDGKLDVRGNNKVHYGLSLIAPIFNKHGWFWGAAYRTEDAMHFEVSINKLKQWKTLNKYNSPVKVESLKQGAKGKDVILLQTKLNLKGACLKLDGDFGKNTKLAVIAFQKKSGLKQDGVVGPRTRKSLGL